MMNRIFKRIIAVALAVMIMASSVVIVSADNYSADDNAIIQATASSADEFPENGCAEGNGNFTWDNATVYMLLTDRFNNGNESNDHSYNRVETSNNVAAFQGGDFKGITQKIEEGYFDDLGINAIWVAGWFEQNHGYVPGGDGKSTFAHYAYHGYHALDFTELDKNFGTEAEFKEMYQLYPVARCIDEILWNQFFGSVSILL